MKTSVNLLRTMHYSLNIGNSSGEPCTTALKLENGGYESPHKSIKPNAGARVRSVRSSVLLNAVLVLCSS
jgi:hypothetical protein